MIDEALENKYGSRYSNKYLTSLYNRGVHAKLYETMSFHRTKKYYSIFFVAGTALGLASIKMGIPQTVIGQIFYIGPNAAGVLGLLYDAFGNKYNADVNYNKEVKVENIYPYRAGKTVYSYSYIGDDNASLTYRKTSKDSDFDNNVELLHQGISNYLEYN